MRPKEVLRDRVRRALGINRLAESVDALREGTGLLNIARLNQLASQDISDHELRVFSQFGEDGILAFLIDRCQQIPPVFVEFGVEDYAESNTRFICSAYGWGGLVIDASSVNVNRIRSSSLAWRSRLIPVHALVTRENINELLTSNGIEGPIGVLSVDIDGNDYWVLNELTVIEPAIVIAEYNALWGSERAVTIPYRADFVRLSAHFSGQYYGASLSAFIGLLEDRGYDFVGTNAHGNNAFFVRSNLARRVNRKSVVDGVFETLFLEVRDASGHLVFDAVTGTTDGLGGLPLIDVETGEFTTVSEVAEL